MTTAEESLRIEVSDRGDKVVLVLQGELDPHTAPRLSDAIADATDESTSTLVLDVSGLAFIDSSGLRVLIAAHKDMQGRSGRLVLRAPTPTTLRLLEITGLADYVTVE